MFGGRLYYWRNSKDMIIKVKNRLLYRLFGIPEVKRDELRPNPKVHSTFVKKLPYNKWVMYIKRESTKH